MTYLLLQKFEIFQTFSAMFFTNYVLKSQTYGVRILVWNGVD